MIIVLRTCHKYPKRSRPSLSDTWCEFNLLPSARTVHGSNLSALRRYPSRAHASERSLWHLAACVADASFGTGITELQSEVTHHALYAVVIVTLLLCDRARGYLRAKIDLPSLCALQNTIASAAWSSTRPSLGRIILSSQKSITRRSAPPRLITGDSTAQRPA